MHRCLVFIDRLRIKLHREHELSGLTRSCILTSDQRLPNINNGYQWQPLHILKIGYSIYVTYESTTIIVYLILFTFFLLNVIDKIDEM